MEIGTLDDLRSDPRLAYLAMREHWWICALCRYMVPTMHFENAFPGFLAACANCHRITMVCRDFMGVD